ncbi:ARM repeat superfamily protein [Striga asiatica]|uniref:ARM repeat superfamily protein n=1 Tax=Striga asiatica TaxID=4170 RepID=A0A5A7PQV7_STRAF|nr:ARM repeat superfamily protein [Striga asiatica]
MRNPLPPLHRPVADGRRRRRRRREARPPPIGAAAAAAARRLAGIRRPFLLRRLCPPAEALGSPNNLYNQSRSNFARVGDALSRPRLRTLVEEDNLCTVDDVRLDTADIKILLNFRNSYHVVVR